MSSLMYDPNMYGGAPNISTALRGLHHRRAHSELSFRLHDDEDDISEPRCKGSSSFEEIGSEDDLFSTYIDLDMLGSNASVDDDSGNVANCTDSNCGGDGEKSVAMTRHRQCNSADGFGGGGESVFGEIMDSKKAMPPDKLAELWAIDPKRAKRILANRQSAARSKERKARYIIELERKVQALQTEATTLSAQMTLFQRDTVDLTTENTELTCRLQAMEQQAHFRDSLNEALQNEIDRLQVATGEKTTNPWKSPFSLAMHNMPYTTSPFFGLPQQPLSASHQNAHFPNFHQSETGMYSHHINASNTSHAALSEYLQNDLQGLDISNGGSLHPTIKSERPSISATASESSIT